ncbi:hypothetical protein [Bermanella sp. R86510]|uniref:hypothetical protein n=1 Tax=unclassified Bermanella TaxID=2627862 RepID=UPI0037CA819D
MLRWGMILLFLPSVVLVTLYMFEAQDAARCAHEGGSWDYIKGICDQQAKHEVVTFMVRHGFWVNFSMLLSLIGLAMTTWGMILKGMGKAKDLD